MQHIFSAPRSVMQLEAVRYVLAFFPFFKDFSFIKEVYNTIKEYKDYIEDCYSGKCTVWTIYKTLYAFYFMFMTVSCAYHHL